MAVSYFGSRFVYHTRTIVAWRRVGVVVAKVPTLLCTEMPRLRMMDMEDDALALMHVVFGSAVKMDDGL